ncbi:hypothetical protein AUP68_11027 [Ilyonectria robusta]
MAQRRQPSLNRACENCTKKKTKCDGRRPECSLCIRTAATCFYPYRKPREPTGLSARARSRSVAYTPASSAQDFALTDQSSSNSNAGSLTTQQQAQDTLADDVPSTAVTYHALESVDMFSYLALDFPQDADMNLANFPCPMIEDVDTLLHDSGGGLDSNGLAVGPPGEDDLVMAGELCTDVAAPDQSLHASLPARRFRMDVSPNLIREMIDLYFLRVQPFLPLFHGPEFLQHYVGKLGSQCYKNLNRVSYLLVNAMSALAARYSTSTHFEGVTREDRGKEFAFRAQVAFRDVSNEKDFRVSLPWLQGCILIAYYNQSFGPDPNQDDMVRHCVNYAADLGLHKVDEDSAQSPVSSSGPIDAKNWSSKEEKRRAWWSVWELDAFGAVSGGRPNLIDPLQARIRLPASDETWFSYTPLDSPMFHANPLVCCRRLSDTQAQDARPWFLMSNYLMVQSHQLAHRKTVRQHEIDEYETILASFSVLYRRKFEYLHDCTFFDDETYAKSNWLVLTNLMILK